MGKHAGSQLMKDGWVPDQHGSWAMAFLPLVSGLIINPVQPSSWLLVVAWTAGFFLFAVGEKYLKFRFKPRYLPALLTYLAITVVAGLALVFVHPQLLWWAPVFAPLVAISAHRAWRRRERELISRVVAIVAAALMVPVTASLARSQPWFTRPWDTHSWLLAMLIAAYFISTVPYVKTLIRERRSQAWLVGSILTHLALWALIAALAVSGWVGWPHLVVWSLIFVRAVAMPLVARRRGRPWRPREIGIPEVVLTVLVALTLPW